MGDVQRERGRSIAAIAATVLGIVAIVLSWMPFINNLAFFIGLIGLVFALVALIGVLRGRKAGKGLAVAAVALNVIALAVVLVTQGMYGAAMDEAANGPSATGTSQSEPVQEDVAGDGSRSYADLAVGTSVDLENGLSVSVDSVQTGLQNYDGSAVVGVQVTYVNKGDGQVDYNPYDWKGEDSQGAQESLIYYDDESNALNAGTLAAGGSVTGNVYFEGDTVKAVYYGTFIADEPTASWALA